MVRHSTTTASLFSVLLAVLIVSLFLVGGAAAQTENTSLGTGALQNNTTGELNTAIGLDALFSNTTGGSNTAIGVDALVSNTTGELNTAIGAQALANNTTGSSNTAIGAFADVAENLTNATAIGQGAEVEASNKIRLGNTAVTVIEGQVAFTAVSDKTKLRLSPSHGGVRGRLFYLAVELLF